MTKLIISLSFKITFKTIIKRKPELKSKIESKLRLLSDDLDTNYNKILTII